MLDSALKTLVENAFKAAHAAPKDPAFTRTDKQWQSHAIVKYFAEEFAKVYTQKDGYHVFSIAHESELFRRNEFLYDIHVCRVKRSAVKDLPYVVSSEWQVESELAKDSREALIDFSKLVTGAARNKLFIGPIVSEREREDYLNSLVDAAEACSGSVYLAQVPHPENWQTLNQVELLKFWTGKWSSLRDS